MANFFVGSLVTLLCLVGFSYLWSASNSKDYFLVANRSLSLPESIFSIASSWIWAPALFVSAQQAYQHGWIGLLWFTVPNVACLILFSFFAKIIKQDFPAGFTLSEYIRNYYSNRVQTLYWITLSGLTVCAFAVQLLAGAKLIELVFGIPFIFGSIVMATVPLSYSLLFGLKSSVVTDFLKMIIVLVLGGVLLWLLFSNGVSFNQIINGMGGISNNYGSFFSNESLALALTFGIPVSIGLLSAPFGDQSMWQRAFATKSENILSSFILGAIVFVSVPLLMGTIGFAAAGSLFSTTPGMVNFKFIETVLGTTGILIFSVIVMSSLLSILDSKLLAIAGIAGADVTDRFGGNFLTNSRISMCVLAMLAILIANIPNMEILYLFLFYGSLRSVTFVPTIYAILKKKADEQYVFIGILLGLLGGLPIFSIGNINKIPSLIILGSVSAVMIPWVVIIIGNKRRGYRSARQPNCVK